MTANVTRTEVWNVRGRNYTVTFSRDVRGWRAHCPDLRKTARDPVHAVARANLREKMMAATARRPKGAR